MSFYFPRQKTSGILALLLTLTSIQSVYSQSGVMVGMGDNRHGALGTPIPTLVRTPVQLANNISAVGTSTSGSYLLTTSGALLASGANGFQQWGQSPAPWTSTFFGFREIWSDVTDFSAKYDNTVVLSSGGILTARGSNRVGQLGYGAPLLVTSPTTLDSDVVQVAGSTVNTVWIKSDDTLWGIGSNFGDAFGTGTNTQPDVPVMIATDVAKAISGGNSTYFIKKDGSLWASGINHFGQFGLGHTTNQSVPVKIADGVLEVASQSNRTLFIKQDGSLWGMGYNANGELGPNTFHPQVNPVQIAPNATQVSVGQFSTLYVDSSGTAWGFGRNDNGQLGLGDSVDRSSPEPILNDVASVSAGSTHSLFLKTDGTAWGAGQSTFGLLGSEVTTVTTTPERSAARVSKLAAGNFNSYQLRDNGTLWSSGWNFDKTLGIATEAYLREGANFVSADVTNVVAGREHMLFTKSDGSVWFAGNRSYGAAGVVPFPASTPVVKIADSGIAIAAGYRSSYIVDSSGVLWGSGENTNGQLGLGHSAIVYNRTQIATNVVAVAAGNSHSVFITNDGGLWGMGANGSGVLGTGTGSESQTPVYISPNVVSAACGWDNTYFLNSSGQLMGLGRNTEGQLGEAPDLFRNATPVLIAENVTAFAAGQHHVVWIDATGDLWGIGRGDGGQLGGPVVGDLRSPRLLARQVTAVAAGEAHTIYVQVPESNLTNLSSRVALSGGADGRLVAGFVIGGTEPVTALVRAVGPTLSNFGVQTPLANPSLQIFNGSAEVVGANDDWESGGSTTELASVFNELGAFNLGAGSADAAVLVTLQPGAYTAHVSGDGSEGGTVLLEIYNRNPASWRSRLVNLSVRTDAGSGENTLIAGFVTAGPSNASLLVRAVGPTLSNYGVEGVLSDPRLAIFRGAENIESNDDWSNDATIIEKTSEVGGFELATNSSDAATIVDLASGAYTTQVAGATEGDSGQALLEVYVIDK